MENLVIKYVIKKGHKFDFGSKINDYILLRNNFDSDTL